MNSASLLVRQCRDTFIRVFDDVGYITSQLTQHDRTYDEIGSVFLQHISRTPRRVTEIVRALQSIFDGVSEQIIEQDFLEFIADLEADSFVVTGCSSTEIDRKEPRFSYLATDPKTFTFDFRPARLEPFLADTDDFLRERFRQHPRILGMQIEASSHCNERCIHCYLPPDRDRRHIETALMLDVMDQAQEMGAIGMIFSGGEFLLHPEYPRILDHAARNDFMISVLANGTLLTDEVVACLKAANCNLIQVSLYSMNAAVHDGITQVAGSHRRTLCGLERLLAADIPVQISCPIMKANGDAYADVLAWGMQHRIKVQTDLVIMARSDFDTTNLAQRAAPQETEPAIRDMLALDAGYQALLTLTPESIDLERWARRPVCGAGNDSLCMDSSGNYYPCAGWQGYVVGNAYKQRLRDVWEHSEGLQVLRRTTNASLPACLQCEARDYCAVCLAKNFNENNGDMFKVNPHYCNVAFLNKRLVEEYRPTSHDA